MVAHRGASEAVPEHTLPAYRQAIDDGADAVECDVRLTRDGHLVCVHDRRVDRTSNGRGPVSTSHLDDLARLDWSSWHSGDSRDAGDAGGFWRSAGSRRSGWSDLDAEDRPSQAPDLDPERFSVLTLERLCEVVAEAPRPVGLAIEAKHPTRYGGLVERRVVETLRPFGWVAPRPQQNTPVRFMSFSNTAVRRMRMLAPRVPTVLLFQRVPLLMRDGALPYGVPVVGPCISVVRRDPAYVERVHSRGGKVHVWTVNRDEDVRLCRDLNVDAIITDRPGHVLKLLGR